MLHDLAIAGAAGVGLTATAASVALVAYYVLGIRRAERPDGIYATWDDVPRRCACKYAARGGSWVRTEVHPACPEGCQVTR